MLSRASDIAPNILETKSISIPRLKHGLVGGDGGELCLLETKSISIPRLKQLRGWACDDTWYAYLKRKASRFRD